MFRRFAWKYGINLTINDSINPPLAVQAILGGKLGFMSAIGTAPAWQQRVAMPAHLPLA